MSRLVTLMTEQLGQANGDASEFSATNKLKLDFALGQYPRNGLHVGIDNVISDVNILVMKNINK